METRKMIVGMVVAVLVLMSGTALATDYYVAKDGNDSWNGLYPEKQPGDNNNGPWETIQKAADTMVAGDTVYIMEGNYVERVEPNNAGSDGNDITYTNYEEDKVIIESPNDWAYDYCIYLPDDRDLHHLVFKNLTLKGANWKNFHAEASESYPKSNIILEGLTIESGYVGIEFINGVKDSEIRNCQIHHNQHGIFLSNDNENILIDKNHVSNSQIVRPEHDNWWSHGICVTGKGGKKNRHITITNNHVHRCLVQGILVQYTSNVLVKGNHCHHNGATGIQIEGAWSPPVLVTNVVVEDNICEDNSQSFGTETGIWIDDSNNVVVQNNIMRGNEIGLQITGSYQVIARHNKVYKNRHSQWDAAAGIMARSSSQALAGDDNMIIHNTLYNNGEGGTAAQISFGLWDTDPNVKNAVFKNNITSESLATYDLWIQMLNHTLNYNNYYNSTRNLLIKYEGSDLNWTDYLSQSGQDANSITGNPLFIDAPNAFFGLYSDSNAIDAGDFLTKATNSGSPNTILVVEDARYFSDGYDVCDVDGDLIMVGSAGPVEVIDVNYDSNTLTLGTSISWSANDVVSYPYSDSSPDMGAYESNIVHNVTQNKWYDTIQGALDDANDGDEIVVYTGTYKENVDFNGVSCTVRSAEPNNWNAVAATIIDGNNAGRVVLFDSSEDANSVLMGFTITGGKAPVDSSGYYPGSGIFCDGSSPKIANCLITGNEPNQMDSDGTIACYRSANPEITNCIIKDNITDWSAGICIWNSSPTIKNCIISNNSANYDGGGIYCYYNGDALIKNCTISENAAENGGGLINVNSDPCLVNCIIWGNKASGNGDEVYKNDVGNPTFYYSDVNGCGGSDAWDHNFGNDGGGNIDLDPCFVNTDANDFHIESDSPCLNAGDPNGDYSSEKDIDGDPRRVDIRIDIGADEIFSLRAYNVTQDWYYLSIQPALNDACDQDYIRVYPGTYYEAIDFNGVACTLRSTDPNDWDVVNATVIDANGATQAVDVDANATISGFTITGGGTYGVYCDSASPTISKCIIEDNSSAGVYCNGGSPVIINNKVCDNDDFGIRSYASIPTIKNNWVYHNGNTGIKFEGQAGSAGTVRNNTVAYNTVKGVWSHGNATEPNVSNCILWENDNDIAGCEATYSCIQDGDVGRGNISSDPCFVDSDANDFHIDPNSLCINAGNPSEPSSTTEETDIDGEPRVLGIVDMGADETSCPLSRWRFDEGSGSTAYDSARDNDGTINGDPTWVAGKIGNHALDFNGVGDYVETNDSPFDFGSDKDFSVSAWIKTTYSDASWRRIVDKSMAGTSPYTGFYLWISSSKVSIRLKDDADVVTATTTSDCNNGEWHLITSVADRDGDLQIYHNYQPEDSNSLATVDSINNDANLAIGRSMDYDGQYFDGAIDDVRIYDRALTAEEIRLLYLRGIMGLDP